MLSKRCMAAALERWKVLLLVGSRALPIWSTSRAYSSSVNRIVQFEHIDGIHPNDFLIKKLSREYNQYLVAMKRHQSKTLQERPLSEPLLKDTDSKNAQEHKSTKLQKFSEFAPWQISTEARQAAMEAFKKETMSSGNGYLTNVMMHRPIPPLQAMDLYFGDTKTPQEDILVAVRCCLFASGALKPADETAEEKGMLKDAISSIAFESRRALVTALNMTRCLSHQVDGWEGAPMKINQFIATHPLILKVDPDAQYGAQETLSFLSSLGVTNLAHAIVRAPGMLQPMVIHGLKTLVNYLLVSLKLSRADILHLLKMHPQMLETPSFVASQLESLAALLFVRGMTREDVAHIIKTCPDVSSESKKVIHIKLDWLEKRCGFTKDDIIARPEVLTPGFWAEHGPQFESMVPESGASLGVV